MTIWDAFLDASVASKLPFRSADIYGYLKLLSPVSRAHFLFHALHLALELAGKRDANTILLNAYWYKYFATEVAHGGDPLILRRLAAGFPEPDLTFYLTISPLDALARKRQRSDYESGYGDEDKFLVFQQHSHAALDTLADEFAWIKLDGAAAPADLTAAMLERIREDSR
ncbi:thymidylate kinase [Mycobacteroides chelonae]|nr:thymidylate kinase [Mycobacteroides chelonae]